jgi:hypothetical protein
MSRLRLIPLRGDVTAAAVAELLRLSLPDFKVRRAALQHCGFPDLFEARLISDISYFTMYSVGGRLA